VIIVAGGKGTRAGGDELKQFRWIAGKPMLLHSLQRFQQRDDVAIVIVVLPHEHVGDPPPWLFQCDTERLLLSVGGRERSDSVRNGLEDLPDDVGIVVVHDAALRSLPTP
jgi:2-C-methyl-D-erythritol 4-phosphate cytidylyltransferase